MYYLGIDLGGTNIASAVVDEEYRIIGRGNVKANAPRPAEQIADSMAESANMAIAAAGISKDRIKWMGVGTPGSVILKEGLIGYANNLQFRDVPMKAMMEARLGIPCYLANDANAAAYGELLAGAGRGSKDFIAITLGTGVGGGIIIDGRIYTGYNDAAGELGHMVIAMDGEECTCGRRGCIEAYASATALIRQTKAAMEQHPESVMWELTGGDLDRVSGRTAFDAMRKGDTIGLAVVQRYLDYLACGLANYINIFQPEFICLGGGISKEGETILAPLREKIARESYGGVGDKPTQLCVARLGNDAGIIGAAMLGRLEQDA